MIEAFTNGVTSIHASANKINDNASKKEFRVLFVTNRRAAYRLGEEKWMQCTGLQHAM